MGRDIAGNRRGRRGVADVDRPVQRPPRRMLRLQLCRVDELEELVGKLQNAGADPAEMRELVEAAIGIGIHRASQWLGL